MAPVMGLTPRQRQFVKEYLVDKSATKAAIRAGYSERSAHSCGPRLLENAGVRAEIQKGLKRLGDKALSKAELKIEDVVRELRNILMADPLDGLEPDGTVKPLSEWPPELRRALSGFEVKEDMRFEDGVPIVTTVRKLRFWSKTESGNQLLRHLGGYKDTITLQLKLEDLILKGRDNDED